MPDNGSLETKIRDLVARAVADAPRPPELDLAALPEVELDHGHRRWWIGGGAALLAAAAAITTLLLVNGTEQSVRTPPATDPSIVIAPAPSLPPDEATDGTEVATVSGLRPFVTAGPDGVVYHRGRRARVLTTEAMAIALDTGDGQVILQRRRGEGGGTGADTEPLIITSAGSIRPLFDGFDWGGYVTLHDVEVVAGRRLLLYSVFEGEPPRPQTLFVVDLGTGAPEEIGATDVDPVNRLHLAGTGLIVGTYRNQLSHGIEINAVPGSPAAEARLPTAADLGLEARYDDCSDCPAAFTVTSDGERVAWTEGGRVHAAFTGVPDSAMPIALVPDGLLADVDFDKGGILFSFGDTEQARVPVVARLDGRRPPELEGATATFSPLGNASPVAPASAVPTTAPPAVTTTTIPPTTTDAAAILTAGPAGVVERRGGETRTLTAEPMVIALDAGDDGVIVQRHAGNGGDWTDADTAPLVLAADGTLTELFGTSDWDGGVVLHDVEVVDGRRLLLFGLQRPQVPQEPNEDLYVIDLDTRERTLVAEDIGGWEFGTGRLHLARTGLIVGEASAEVVHSIAIEAVPGSPAAAAGVPTPAALGLEDSYSDCFDCPQTFSVAPDGATVAWIDGATNQLMRVPVAGGTAEPIVDVPAERYADLDYDNDRAVLSSFEFVSAGATPAPIEVPFDGRGAQELDGTAATLSPAGAVATPPPTAVAEPSCGIDPQAGSITDAIGDVPPPFDGFPGWAYGGDTNFDPCAALSYARLDTEGGTGSSPVQLMLFHEGAYVGTATECALPFTTVTSTSTDSVTVEYRWLRPGDPNAAPSGLATVTFRWAGDAVQMDGELPVELLEGAGCPS